MSKEQQVPSSGVPIIPVDDNTADPISSSIDNTIGEFEDSINAQEEVEEIVDSSSQCDHNVPCSKAWTQTIRHSQVPMKRVLHALTHSAATHPAMYIVGMIILAFSLLAIGLSTNYYVEVDVDVLWTPFNSKPISHKQWIENGSGFPDPPGLIVIQVHKRGENVLSMEGVRRVFAAVDTVRSIPGYASICARSKKQAESGSLSSSLCMVEGVMSFWNDTIAVFEDEVSSDEDAIRAMSADFYPDGKRVDRAAILGNAEATDNTGNVTLLNSAQIYVAYVPLINKYDAVDFEGVALETLLDLRDAWDNQAGNDFVLEVSAKRSFDDEINRAIIKDIPLVPTVFVIMSIFTCAVFFKWNKVESKTMLGFGAVVCVLLSIMSGYGLMFWIGVPFSPITQILPFAMFGIGLDDAFILSVAYERTDPTKDPVERVRDMIDQVGVSVTLTTLTSALAFGLGCISTVPGVYWLCLYAFPTIIIDFVFQLTFFIAILVVDERRIRDNRRDCFICVTSNHNNAADKRANVEQEQNLESSADNNFPASYRFMTWYAEQLLRPWMKVSVILAFIGLFVGLAVSATRMGQQFLITDVLPDDSYLADFYIAQEDYSTEAGVSPMVYFRSVNQSDPAIQAEMGAYIEELVVKLEEIDHPPTRFWLWDFQDFLETEKDIANAPFRDQLNAFLSNPVFSDLYADHIVLDNNGEITASRTMIILNNLDLAEVKDQIDVLKKQRRVSQEQPVNLGRNDWAFFTYEGIYNIWEFFSVSIHELFLTTIIGVVAVTVVGFVFIPHWSAVLYVCPMIIILYIDLIGFMQLCGLHINVVSYISLVLSIGLMVDFIIHPLLRYFEAAGDSRTEKVIEMLQSMGASILIGGTSTFIGIIPLAFSTSAIFFTIFVAFLGLVVLGLLHGLVLLPVVLSLIGTNDKCEF